MSAKALMQQLSQAEISCMLVGVGALQPYDDCFAE